MVNVVQDKDRLLREGRRRKRTLMMGGKKEYEREKKESKYSDYHNVVFSNHMGA
jgi:hypothetical protein